MTCNRKTYYIEPEAAQALRRDGLGWMISDKGSIILDRIKGAKS